VLPCCFFSSALAEFYTVFERGVVSSILAQKGGLPGGIGEVMFGWNLTNERLSQQELENYLMGRGGSITGGYWAGAGLYGSETWFKDKEGNKANNLFFQAGFTLPGANASGGYTWKIGEIPDFWN
jgi:hypothetical protein